MKGLEQRIEQLIGSDGTSDKNFEKQISELRVQGFSRDCPANNGETCTNNKCIDGCEEKKIGFKYR